MLNRVARWVQATSSGGILGAATMKFATMCNRFVWLNSILLFTKFSRYPLICRLRTSDREAFRGIFIWRDYAALDQTQNVGLIVDCGAYVGYSSAYFLSAFPNSHLVAIEPDPENYSVLIRNLSRFSNRVKLHHAAIWSKPGSLSLSETHYRDGEHWSKHVRECRVDDTYTIPAIDIPTILAQSEHERISILKVDIEGAEAVLFGKGNGVETWIGKVDNIAIELHDDSDFGPCTSIFADAIADQGFEISHSGDVTICKRRS
jgi:FkbM family methyltransferase